MNDAGSFSWENVWGTFNQVRKNNCLPAFFGPSFYVTIDLKFNTGVNQDRPQTAIRHRSATYKEGDHF